jgi:hypothetical protein
MGIQAMVIMTIASAAMQAKAARGEAEAANEQEESALKSRELTRMIELNDMMASNAVNAGASGLSMVSGTLKTIQSSSENKFKLQVGSDRITTGNKMRANTMQANNAQTMALMKSATSVVGGYNDASNLAGKGKDFNYFGMNFKNDK